MIRFTNRISDFNGFVGAFLYKTHRQSRYRLTTIQEENQLRKELTDEIGLSISIPSGWPMQRSFPLVSVVVCLLMEESAKIEMHLRGLFCDY